MVAGARVEFGLVFRRRDGTISAEVLMGRIKLSAAALALFRLHVERHGQIDVDDSNREIYRELARAGIMVAGHSFTGGDESIYRLTREGFERKAELLVISPSPGIVAARLA
jgi:hypothetical protein